MDNKGFYDAIFMAVAQKEYVKMMAKDIRSLGTGNAVLFDVKGMYQKSV